ncbi:hypothetical protein B0H14DRAFT_2567658 [Mycena olivaceomarginata]|nr:hypothetical protein B0H14DRAFT_2567658 [Mycena olivaceomarginata]
MPSLNMDLEHAHGKLNASMSMAIKDHKIPRSVVTAHQQWQHPISPQAFIDVIKMPLEDVMRGRGMIDDAILGMVQGFSSWPEEHWMEAFKAFPVPREDLSVAGKFCRAFLDIFNSDELDSISKVASQLHLLIQHVSENNLSTYTTNLLATKALVKLTSDFLFDHLINKSETETIITMTQEVCHLRLDNVSTQSIVLRDIETEITEAFRLGRFLLDVEEIVFNWLTFVFMASCGAQKEGSSEKTLKFRALPVMASIA